jgi:hypothetical protein
MIPAGLQKYNVVSQRDIGGELDQSSPTEELNLQIYEAMKLIRPCCNWPYRKQDA